MAATTLAQTISLVGDKLLMEILYEAFVQPDPFAARMTTKSDIAGMYWKEKYRASNASAAGLGFYGTKTPSAVTFDEFQAFLSRINRGDQYNMLVQAQGTGDQGFNDKVEKIRGIFDALALLMREYEISGQPATSVIGATLQALLGASATVELGPRNFYNFAQVHPQDGTTVVDTYGRFRWVNASAALSYMAPGDTEWGPAQTVSTSNWYRIPLFSGGTTGNKNPAKWIRVTLDPVATILAAGNYTSTAATALETVVFTPSLQPTGIWTQIHPQQSVYGDLTGAATDAGITADSTGPVSGSVVNRKNLSWLRKRLLFASNNDPSRCAILAPENLITGTMEGLVTHLGHGVDPIWFMGSELNSGFSYGNIAVLDNAWVPTNLTSSDGTTDLTAVVGVVLGDDATHMKTLDYTGDMNMSQRSNVISGGTATGDGTPGGTPMPIRYAEQINASTNDLVDLYGDVIMEMVVPFNCAAAITHVANQ
jgi:hypothetical protein